jgi:hypothetical protein
MRSASRNNEIEVVQCLGSLALLDWRNLLWAKVNYETLHRA